MCKYFKSGLDRFSKGSNKSAVRGKRCAHFALVKSSKNILSKRKRIAGNLVSGYNFETSMATRDADCNMKDVNPDTFIISVLFNLVATSPVCKEIWYQIDDFSKKFKLRPTIYVGPGRVGPTVYFVYLVSGAERDSMLKSANDRWKTKINDNPRLRGNKYHKLTQREFQGRFSDGQRMISDVQFRNGLTEWGFPDNMLALRHYRDIVRDKYLCYIANNTDMPADVLHNYVMDTTDHSGRVPSVRYDGDGKPIVGN